MMLEELFEAEPSTPMPTGAPAASSSLVGQMPEASTILDAAQ